MEFDIIIRKLDCIPLMDNLINVVTNVHWSLIGKLDGRQHQININTHLPNDELNISNFTEYKDITLDMMVEWIRKESGENGMDNYKELRPRKLRIYSRNIFIFLKIFDYKIDLDAGTF